MTDKTDEVLKAVEETFDAEYERGRADERKEWEEETTYDLSFVGDKSDELVIYLAIDDVFDDKWIFPVKKLIEADLFNIAEYNDWPYGDWLAGKLREAADEVEAAANKVRHLSPAL